MLIGHVAAGLAAKKFTPKTGVRTTILAAIIPDLLGGILLICGIERVRIQPGITAVNPFDLEYYPWSHSLSTTLLWALLASGIYYIITKHRRGAAWLTIAVISHWILDFVSHIPDLPLWPGGPKVGLGLWMSVSATIVVEGGFFAIATLLYWRATRAKNTWGHVALWLPVSFLILFYVSTFFGPPPPVEILGWFQLSFILFPFFGWWMDRTRVEINLNG